MERAFSFLPKYPEKLVFWVARFAQRCLVFLTWRCEVR
jgi:hypothetical protein